MNTKSLRMMRIIFEGRELGHTDEASNIILHDYDGDMNGAPIWCDQMDEDSPCYLHEAKDWLVEPDISFGMGFKYNEWEAVQHNPETFRCPLEWIPKNKIPVWISYSHQITIDTHHQECLKEDSLDWDPADPDQFWKDVESFIKSTTPQWFKYVPKKG